MYMLFSGPALDVGPNLVDSGLAKREERLREAAPDSPTPPFLLSGVRIGELQLSLALTASPFTDTGTLLTLAARVPGAEC